jgi:ribosomal protein S18 acetylase RimI-like enzyme
MLEIRSYEAADREALVTLWNLCGLVRPANDPFRDIDRKLRVRGDLLRVGVSAGQIVASVMVGYEGHRGWLNYLAVDPGHRQKGIGRQMVREAERLLAAEGCPKVNLQVRTTNTEAIKFYTAIGYAQDDALSFGKRLEPDP